MKKAETLTSQFRREVKKMKSKSGIGIGEVYRGNWFAFKSLTFLMDQMKPRTISDAGMEVCKMAYTVNIYYT